MATRILPSFRPKPAGCLLTGLVLAVGLDPLAAPADLPLVAVFPLLSFFGTCALLLAVAGGGLLRDVDDALDDGDRGEDGDEAEGHAECPGAIADRGWAGLDATEEASHEEAEAEDHEANLARG